MRSSSLPSVLAIAACAVMAALPCLAAELTVTTAADESNTPAGAELSLREAIRDAAAGDTIRFAPALNGGTLAVSGALVVSKNLTIDAMSLPDGFSVDGSETKQLLYVPASFSNNPTVVVRGLNFLRGRGLSSSTPIQNQGQLTLDHCTVSKCKTTSLPTITSSASPAGSSPPSLTLLSCAVTSNRPDSTFGTDGGGGLYLGSGSAKFVNCTISGNEAYLTSAISIQPGASANLIHCTISNNRTQADFAAAINNSGTLRLENSVIASNLTRTGAGDWKARDVGFSSQIQIAGKNFLSTNDGVSTQFPAGPTVGTSAAPLDPLLAAVARQGGRTECLLPLSGSPLLNLAVGSANTPTTDQRDLARTVGAKADLGSVEANIAGYFSLADTSTGVSVRPVLEWSYELNATSYRVWLGTSPGSLTVAGSTTTGRFAPPELLPSTTYYWQIESTVAGVPTLGPLLSFTTRSHIEVTKTADETAANAASEPGVSLREAVLIANATPGYDVIRFQAGLGGGLFQIASSIAISDPLRIGGDSVSGGITCIGGNFQTTAAAEFRHMTIANTRSAFGNGILDLTGDFTAVNCTLAGNKAARGGAIYLRSGVCTLVHCTVTGNSASLEGGGICRGGGSLVLENCIVAGNRSQGIAQDILATQGVTLRGNNLVGDNSGAETAIPAGPLVGTSQSPKIAALGLVAAHVAGKAWHCPLLTGSPAIDQALPLPTSPTGDLIGNLLPPSGADLGAVQRDAALDLFQPANEAADISSQPLLLWNLPGESFQVLLGTSAESLAAVGSTGAGSFQLSGLAESTTYYWRIDATVNGSVVSGPLLSFATRGTLVVSTAVDENDPNPADGNGISLREALAIARSRPGSNRIVFAPSLPATIPLDGGDLRIETGVDIDASSRPDGIHLLSSNGANFRVFAGGEFALRRCEISGGQSIPNTSTGTIIKNSYGSLRLQDCHIHHNQGDSLGGAIYCISGRLVAERSTFDHNTAGSGGQGGAIYSSSSIATIANCTFHANSATSRAAISASGSTEIIHSTISGNTATNSPTFYGALSFADSGGILENCIVAGNTGGDLGDVAPVARGANLIGNNQNFNSTFPTGPLAGTAAAPLDPKLLPLARYGGFAPTMPPRFGSPAIDAAPVATVSLATDQRGLPRVLGSSADLGAAEVLPLNAALVDGDSDGMDDRLEALYGFTVGTADGSGDLDGDGSSNADELANHTDPADPNSVLRVASISQLQPPSGGSGPVMRVTWAGFPGMSYTIELSQDLGFGTGSLREIPAGAADSSTRTMDVPMLPGRDFLRIRRD